MIFLFAGKAILPDKYLIHYGKKSAPIKIIEYFAFGCKGCLKNFKDSFEKIRKELIDTNKVEWVFCPYPLDVETVRFMHIYAMLPFSKKKIFFEVLMNEEFISELIFKIVLKDLNAFQRDIDFTDVYDSLEDKEAFKDAFKLTNDLKLDVLPTLSVNGVITDDFPDDIFVNKIKEINT